MLIRIILAFFLLALICACATVPERFESTADHALLELPQLLTIIEQEPILFIGEAHSEERDHRFQLEVIRHLHRKGRQVAVALEVFPRDRQQLLQDWNTGALKARPFALAASSIWDDLYHYYGPILRFSRDAGIPLYGIGATAETIGAVAQQGPGIVPPDQRRSLQFSPCDDDPPYADLMQDVAAMNIHESSLPYFCDAQRFSDTVMANNLLEIMHEGQFTVVVLAGAAHASKIALPRFVQQRRTASSVVLLPAAFQMLIQRPVDARLADYVWY